MVNDSLADTVRRIASGPMAVVVRYTAVTTSTGHADERGGLLTEDNRTPIASLAEKDKARRTGTARRSSA